MKNKQGNKKSILVFCLAMLFFLCSVSAVLAITSSELWQEWGYNNAGTQNRLGDSIVYGDVSNLSSYNQASYGSYYQPLVNDIDFDGTMDIVIQSANYLLVYDNEWGLQAQTAISLTGQPTLTQSSDLENDGFSSYESYILVHNETSAWIYDFNGSTIAEVYELNASDDENISLGSNGFKCFYESTILSSEVCISKYLRYDERNFSTQRTGGFLSIVIPDTCHNGTCITTTYWDFDDLNHTLVTIPNFMDIDQSGSKEVIFWSDFDGNGSYGYSIFHTTAQSRYTYKDEIFSDATEYTNSYGRNNPLMYDLNTGGHGEVYFYKIYDGDAGGANLYIHCYDTSGTICAGFPVEITDGISNIDSDVCGIYGSAKSWLTNPAIMEIDGDEVLGFLGFGYGSVNTYECGFRYCGTSPADFNFLGYVYPNGTIFQDYDCPSPDFSVGASGRAEVYLTSADFDNDNNDDWINPLAIFMNSNISDNHTLDAVNYWTIPVDLDGDSYYDLISMGSSAGYTYLTGGINSGATIDEVSSDTGSPTCINQEVIFTLTDYTDAELNAAYLRIDCEGTGSYTDWSSASYSPYNTCNFTSYGTFDIVFSITDSGNYPTETDNLVCEWVVDSGNCYSSGEGGGLTCQSTANATGFNDFFINSSVMGLDETDTDGYAAVNFDWEGSGCDEWDPFWRGVCPLVKWVGTGLDKIWDWIFGFFWLFLVLLLIIVVVAFFIKNRDVIMR